MPWGVVQTLDGGQQGAQNPSLAASFAANVQQDNRILVFVGWYNLNATNDISTPSSSPSLTWTKLAGAVVTVGAGRFYSEIWSAVVASTGSLQITVSATSTSTGSELGWTAGEFDLLDTSAGSGCLDVSAAGTGHDGSGASTSVATGTTGATGADNQLAVAVYADWGASLTISPPSGFNKEAGLSRDSASTVGQSVASKTSLSGATEGGSFTYSSASPANQALVAVIKVIPDAPSLSLEGRARASPHM